MVFSLPRTSIKTAGINCANAHVKTYGYNVSKSVEKISAVPAEIAGELGNIAAMKQYLPAGLDFSPTGINNLSFYGNIKECNW